MNGRRTRGIKACAAKSKEEVQVRFGVPDRSNVMRHLLENPSTCPVEINAYVTKTKVTPAPKINNVWEERRAKFEAIKKMLPYNSDHEEIMIKQAILLSQQQAVEDERQRRQKEKENEAQLKYLASISCSESNHDNELCKEFSSQVCKGYDLPDMVNEESIAKKLTHPFSTPFEVENFSIDRGIKLEVHQFKQSSEACDIPASLNGGKKCPFPDFAKNNGNKSLEDLSLLNNDKHKMGCYSEMKTGFYEKTSDVPESTHSVASEDYEVCHSLCEYTQKSFIGIKNIEMEDFESGLENTANVKGQAVTEKKMPLQESFKNLGDDGSSAECPSSKKLAEKNQCNQYYICNPSIIPDHNETLEDNLNCNSLKNVPDSFIPQTEVTEVKQNILYETNDVTEIDNILRKNIEADIKKSSTDNASRKRSINCNLDHAVCATATLELSPEHKTIHKLKDEYCSSNWCENLETSTNASDKHLKVPETCVTPDQNPVHNISQSVPNSLNTTSLTFEHSYGSSSSCFPNSTCPPTDMIAGSLPMSPGLYPPLLWQQMMMMNLNPFFVQQLQMLQMCYAPQNPLLPMTHLPINNNMGMVGYPQNYFSLSNTNSHIPAFASSIPQRTETVPEARNTKSLSSNHAMNGMNNSYISSYPGVLETKSSRLDTNSIDSNFGKQQLFSKDFVDNPIKVPVCNPENSDSSVERLAMDFINSPSLPHTVGEQSNMSSGCQIKSYTSQCFGTSEPSAVKNCSSEESRRMKLHMKFFGDSDISIERSEPMPCIKPPRQVTLDQHKSKSVKLEPIRQPKQNPKHILHSMTYQDSKSIKKNYSAIPTINSHQDLKKCWSNQRYPPDTPTHLSEGNEKIREISMEGSSEVAQTENYNDQNCGLIAFSNERLKSSLNSNIPKVKSSVAYRQSSKALLVEKRDLTDKNMQINVNQGNHSMNSKDLALNEEFCSDEWNDIKNSKDLPTKNTYGSLPTKNTYGSGIWDEDDDSNYSACSSIDNLSAVSHDNRHCSDNIFQPVCLPNTRWPRNGNFTMATNLGLKNMCRDPITTERNPQGKEERIAKPLSTVHKLFKKSCRKPNH